MNWKERLSYKINKWAYYLSQLIYRRPVTFPSQEQWEQTHSINWNELNKPKFVFRAGVGTEDIFDCLEPSNFFGRQGDLTTVYTTFAGIDMKLLVGSKVLAETQAIDINVNLEDDKYPVSGKLTTVLFDKSILERVKAEVEAHPYITLVACNEFGQMAKCAIHDVEFINYKWAMSIDDIVSEEHIHFKAKSIDGWKSWGINQDKLNNLLEK